MGDINESMMFRFLNRTFNSHCCAVCKSNIEVHGRGAFTAVVLVQLLWVKQGFQKEKKVAGGYSEVPEGLLSSDSSTVQWSRGLCQSIRRKVAGDLPWC